jgi:hypothetical protein
MSVSSYQLEAVSNVVEMARGTCLIGANVPHGVVYTLGGLATHMHAGFCYFGTGSPDRRIGTPPGFVGAGSEQLLPLWGATRYTTIDGVSTEESISLLPMTGARNERLMINNPKSGIEEPKSVISYKLHVVDERGQPDGLLGIHAAVPESMASAFERAIRGEPHLARTYADAVLTQQIAPQSRRSLFHLISQEVVGGQTMREEVDPDATIRAQEVLRLNSQPGLSPWLMSSMLRIIRDGLPITLVTSDGASGHYKATRLQTAKLDWQQENRISQHIAARAGI